ncbi:hypothetical protein [Neptunicella sp.]|uniref:hypothetical protein n=1 Tax=Neptunicella sp. TaxID=2125986 RepID=UPI003F68D09B
MADKLTPQQLANKRQNEKRKGQPRLGGMPLTQDEYDLLDKLAAEYGGKKAAIVAGLKLLDSSD